MNISIPGTQLNIHEDERMKPENWIPLAWLPIINADKSRRPTKGYEGSWGTPCHVLDDGSTRTHLVSSERATMSTAMLQTLKVARRKHGTA